MILLVFCMGNRQPMNFCLISKADFTHENKGCNKVFIDMYYDFNSEMSGASTVGSQVTWT